MICQNCRATVDNDLVFCTSCGARLYEQMSDAPTIVMRDSIAIQASAPAAKSSPFKWLALIIALIALPASLGLAYLLTKNQPVGTTANVNKSAITNRQAESNTPNKNVNDAKSNVSVNNLNSEDGNENDNAEIRESTVVFDERIEIASGAHIAYPFKLNEDAKITGKIQTLRGEPVKGYVFTQDAYDTYFPDTNYKIFSFDGKNPSIEQLLVKGDYVLIFFNESAPAIVIRGKVEIQPNE